jgi:sugar lactone lactonase YvrE
LQKFTSGKFYALTLIHIKHQKSLTIQMSRTLSPLKNSNQLPKYFPVFKHWFLFVFIGLAVFSCNSGNTKQAENQVINESILHQFTYSEKYLDISGQTEDARATFWKPDGTVVFVVGRISNNVVAYKVSEPWQIHTAEFLNETIVPGEFQHGLYIREDGQMMWVFDRTSIWSFELETPWDITTLSAGKNHDLSHFALRGHDINFKPDGSVLFIDDRNAGAIFEYTLTTPWDVASGTLTYTLDISDQQIEVRGIEFLRSGTVMMLMDTERGEVLHYTLDLPFNIATATFADAFDVSEQTAQGRGLSFSADETIMYVTGRDEGRIFQYETDSNQ